MDLQCQFIVSNSPGCSSEIRFKEISFITFEGKILNRRFLLEELFGQIIWQLNFNSFHLIFLLIKNSMDAQLFPGT